MMKINQNSEGAVLDFSTKGAKGRYEAFMAVFMAPPMVLLVLVAVISIFLPAGFNYFVFEILPSPRFPAFLVASNESNASVLSGVGYETYAAGFVALRCLSFILLVFWCPVIFLGAYLYKVHEVVPKELVFQSMPFLFLLTPFFLWFFFLKADMYGAADGDFSGILRPPFGSILFSFVGWSALWASLIASVAVFKVVLFFYNRLINRRIPR